MVKKMKDKIPEISYSKCFERKLARLLTPETIAGLYFDTLLSYVERRADRRGLRKNNRKVSNIKNRLEEAFLRRRMPENVYKIAKEVLLREYCDTLKYMIDDNFFAVDEDDNGLSDEDMSYCKEIYNTMDDAQESI